MLDWEGGGEEVEEGLKSQRPRRRKQAVQVARPMTWSASACQPRSARARAEVLRVVVVGVSSGGFGGGVEGGSGDCGWRRGVRFCESEERSRAAGVERSGGSSEDMATREL